MLQLKFSCSLSPLSLGKCVALLHLFQEKILGVENEFKFCQYFLIHVMLSTTTACLNWTGMNIPHVTKIIIIM